MAVWFGWAARCGLGGGSARAAWSNCVVEVPAGWQTGLGLCRLATTPPRLQQTVRTQQGLQVAVERWTLFDPEPLITAQ